MTDPRTAALAEALIAVDDQSRWCLNDISIDDSAALPAAAAILAALPDDWCAHAEMLHNAADQMNRYEATIARLREALEKIANGSKDVQSVKAARAALEERP